MKYLLDTDICIYLINERPKKVLDHFKRKAVSDIGISSISVSELSFGIAKSGSARNRSALEVFLLPLEIIAYDINAAMVYGEIRAGREGQGKPIGPLDMLIAAHALSQGVTLVTNNEKEFRRVNKLKVENWA